MSIGDAKTAGIRRLLDIKKKNEVKHGRKTKVADGHLTIGKNGHGETRIYHHVAGKKPSSSHAVKDGKAAHKHVKDQMGKGQTFRDVALRMLVNKSH